MAQAGQGEASTACARATAWYACALPVVSVCNLRTPHVHYAHKLQVDYVRNERTILDKLNHPGIVKLSFTFQDPDSLCECVF